DVQITADGIPVLSHDPSLLKVTGRDLVISQTPAADILTLPAGHAERFGARYDELRIATLAEFTDLLGQWPEARAFVEIKHASITAFGIERVLDLVLETLADVSRQCILISFEYEALQHARSCSSLPVGWVLPHWDDERQQLATALEPDYLFVNRKRLPKPRAPLWEGPWRWVVYTVNEAAEIAPFLAHGFDMVETNVIRKLLGGTRRHG
ncbi:MAG: glycerophosphodiester phosphodiesterase family protein, partial [Thiohalobacterales bacterium]|nr:glycerophosphodiester phosphodiesterase family protein [Thiohalobacterales bacterium]